MFLRKKSGGCTIAGYEWAEDGAVTEVPDDLAAELLALAPGEYEHVPEAEPKDPPDDPAEPKRPNQAATAEEWKAYALAMNLPADVVEAATKKTLIDHFINCISLTEQS